MLLKSNEVNQLTKGAIIFQEQEAVTHVCIILKGHIVARNKGSRITLSQGCIIGLPDLFIGRYLSEYVVEEDAIIYPFPASKPKDLEGMFAMNKEYQGLMMYSLCTYIKKLNTVVEELRNCAESIYSYVQDINGKYKEYCMEYKQPYSENTLINRMEPYLNDLPSNQELIEYYLNCSKIPLATLKEYFGHSAFMTMHHVEESAGVITAMMMEGIELTEYIKDAFIFMMNGNEPSLFCKMAEMFLSLKANGTYSKQIMETIDVMVDEINRTDLLFERNTNSRLPVNRANFEKMYCNLISGADTLLSQSEVKEITTEEILENCKDSLRQIFKYSTFEEDKQLRLNELVNQFLNLPDRLSTSEEVRALRKHLTVLFYELYENVFYSAYELESMPKVVELFLNFGFLDERLLSEEQVVSLYRISLDKNEYEVKVYTIFEWLKLIYEGKKEPSKNEFDQDYSDYIRHMKKTEAMSEEQVRARLADPKERLHFEIVNMFTVNNKVVHGQVSTFVPCLYKEVFLNFPEKELLTRERVNQSFARIKGIDYSAFYRESMYVNQDAKIEKEYIMQEVYPDIILMPMAGSSSSMWQEISGKKRNMPGRFILPIFLDTNLDDVMIRLFGRFRWELCRCIQGTAWNNLKHKSLTSEYMDYLQFYRKNRDLTEERKEKLKLQIQKARNNSREVFVLDYEAWIKGEANGAIRLNKVVREIMATYCPFSKEIRQKCMTQPMFAEAYARFQRDTSKKLHDFECRIRNMEKENSTITKEITDTLTYYKEL
ncbi:MAG: hypothetical protein PUC65_05040 [Clostridiales bacterium]|nr:hypothetical protein [Clostridiales bacterium]